MTQNALSRVRLQATGNWEVEDDAVSAGSIKDKIGLGILDCWA
jgi:hypothetical protein